MRYGYHHILVKSEDVHKIDFRFIYEHYEYVVMPFGVTNDLTLFRITYIGSFVHFKII